MSKVQKRLPTSELEEYCKAHPDKEISIVLTDKKVLLVRVFKFRDGIIQVRNSMYHKLKIAREDILEVWIEDHA